MHTLYTRPSRPVRMVWRGGIPAALALLLALALLAGCQKTVVAPATVPAASQSLPDRAFAAYANGDYRTAETLYDRVLQLPELTRDETVDAWKYFALSTVANGKYHLGLEALEKWRSLNPEADTETPWLNAFSQAMTRMPRSKAVDMLHDILNDDSRSWAIRTEASLLLAAREWSTSHADKGNLNAAMQDLAALYNKAPDASGATAYRAMLESRLLAQLQQAEPEHLAALAGVLTPENELHFPYNIVLLEKARRNATDEDSWPVAWQALQRLRQTGLFADKLLVERIILPLEQEFGRPSQGIALALPLTGPYGNIGWKIMRGVGVAQWELARSGNDMAVYIINTESEGWETRLAELPEGIAVVGGPLRKEAFERIESQGLLRRRSFFTFLSNLAEHEEGKVAWRFFPSPKDQVRTMLDFARKDLGIEQYGILSPDEPFGKRMSELFRTAGEEQGVTISRTGSYPPTDSKAWGSALKPMLNVPAPRPGEEDSMPPEPSFQAVFLPDGWQHMQSLIPHFFFYQEDRMIFLGSALWEQGLSTSRDIETRYFTLAVFPGSWNPFAPTTAATNLSKALDESGLGKPDLWVGLGYDFVRFASLLGTQETVLSHDEMNRRIQTAQTMDWSIAPISWTPEGVASQKMFLFTPARNGFVPLDPEQFKKDLEQTRARHEERVKLLEEAYQTKIGGAAQ